ncbi:hypothetical protein CEXT_453271 [Caerostris extrusa]|uniref:Uncharacterized protein n=1 Tax=Caerostris extrusa TaxID=172846 RepID=A0AAV4MPT1_CAEEX|nr:hypothetical protein CEXT_453271 [Caerostris extrusa]
MEWNKKAWSRGSAQSQIVIQSSADSFQEQRDGLTWMQMTCTLRGILPLPGESSCTIIALLNLEYCFPQQAGIVIKIILELK